MSKNKTAIITLNFGELKFYKFLLDFAIPTMKDYADRIGSDFILMKDKPEKYNGTWNQLQCLEYLDYYDRICYFDGDIFINDKFNTNIFDIVPENYIGMEIHPHIISKCNKIFSIFVVDKKYKNIFTKNIPNIENQANTNYECIYDKQICMNNYTTINGYLARLQREECYINQIINTNNINNIYNLSGYIYYSIDSYFKFLHCNTDGGFNDINKKIEKSNSVKKRRNQLIYSILLYYKALNLENIKKYWEKI
jgi:hypothetical protein